MSRAAELRRVFGGPARSLAARGPVRREPAVVVTPDLVAHHVAKARALRAATYAAAARWLWRQVGSLLGLATHAPTRAPRMLGACDLVHTRRERLAP